MIIEDVGAGIVLLINIYENSSTSTLTSYFNPNRNLTLNLALRLTYIIYSLIRLTRSKLSNRVTLSSRPIPYNDIYHFLIDCLIGKFFDVFFQISSVCHDMKLKDF